MRKLTWNFLRTRGKIHSAVREMQRNSAERLSFGRERFGQNFTNIFVKLNFDTFLSTCETSVVLGRC